MTKLQSDNALAKGDTAAHPKRTMKWMNLMIYILLHIYFLSKIYIVASFRWQTWIWLVVSWHFALFGHLGGTHRLWSHKSFKAKLPLRIFLSLGHSTTMMYSIFEWARDHRVHHKYTDTDADPYTAKRGFLFSHLLWVFMSKHPDVIRRGKQIDTSDLLSDPVVAFEFKYHWPMSVLMALVVPSVMPVYLWNETWEASVTCSIMRILITTHAVSAVNSFAHLRGTRPFNKNVKAGENPFISLVCAGEGWHNYHHVFPWDYRASDTGFLNATMIFLQLCERLGLAYDLKTAPPSLVQRMVERFGDGSRPDWLQSTPEVPPEAILDPSLVDKLTERGY